MNKILLASLLLVFSAFALTACGGQSTPAIEAAPQVNIKVETAPDPLAVGDAELSFIITDQNGEPIEGAKVDVGADHTDMTGMGMHGPAVEQGNGRYAIKANFSMSGNWKITVYIRKGDLDVEQDIQFVIK